MLWIVRLYGRCLWMVSMLGIVLVAGARKCLIPLVFGQGPRGSMDFFIHTTPMPCARYFDKPYRLRE